MTDNWIHGVFFQDLCSLLNVSFRGHKSEKTNPKGVPIQRGQEASPEETGSLERRRQTVTGGVGGVTSNKHQVYTHLFKGLYLLTVCWVLRTEQINRVGSWPSQRPQAMSTPDDAWQCRRKQILCKQRGGPAGPAKQGVVRGDINQESVSCEWEGCLT